MKTWLILACIEACSGLEADFLQVSPSEEGDCVCWDSIEKFHADAYRDPINDISDSGCYVESEDPERNRNDY